LKQTFPPIDFDPMDLDAALREQDEAFNWILKDIEEWERSRAEEINRIIEELETGQE